MGTIIVLVLQITIVAHGQTSSTHLFGCQRYGGVMHCDLLLNELDATEAPGNSTLINNLTSKDVVYVSGKSGQSMQMKGEYRDSVEIMNSPELNPNQFSVSFWMRSTTIEPYGVIVSHSNRPQTSGWQFDTFKAASSQSGSEAATLRFGVFNTNGTSFSPPTIEVPTDRFTLITGTFDGSRVRLFMDGQLVGETEFRGSYNGDPGLPMRIGSPSYCSSCNRWSGIIDDLRIYGRTLADEEVRQLYDMSDVSSGLIGYWKFDGDTNDFLQRHHGTAITMLTSMVFAPDGRLFFNEKNTGEIRVMTPQQNILDKPFASVNDLFASWEQGMLGLAIDPEFDSNHYVYLYYTALIDTQSADGGKVINRVVRFTDINNTGTDMRIILDNIPASRGYHSGGAMTFGPDGKLYITVGDATEHIFAQDPSIVIGKVLRINKDGSIPEDNPYPNSPVYTIGHRNLYGIAFDNNGTGLVAENGEARYDEINLITKGGNYGFPTSQPANLPPERSNDTSIKPIRSYWDTIAPTQMIYYTGDAVPELKGMFVFGTFTGDIYALKMSEDGKTIVQEIHIDLEHYPFVPTVGIAQSPDGKIYYGGYQIYTLDSIGEREQALFTISLDSPPGVDVGEIRVDEKQKKISIGEDVNEPLAPNATLIARIPRALLDNITNVAAESKQGANVMEFNVKEFGPDYTTISMNIGSQVQNAGTIELAISSQTQAKP
ncbi:MAG: PQQ-dependent sugar dehydrogenase [Nitrososphaera sp.]